VIVGDTPDWVGVAPLTGLVLGCSLQEVDVCEDGRPLQEVWMVLEFCNRGTLSDAMPARLVAVCARWSAAARPCEHAACGERGTGGAGALEYLHSQNVLHGDLNGNNILLAGAPICRNGGQRGFTAKVADFGLSRILTPGGTRKTHCL